MKVVVPRMWNKIRASFKLPKFKDVKPKDRIKWWNIVPGDHVRVSGDPDGAIHEVKAINKYSNRVYLNMQNVCLYRRVGVLNLTIIYRTTRPLLTPSDQGTYITRDASSWLAGSNSLLLKGVRSLRHSRGSLPSISLYILRKETIFRVFATRIATSEPHWHPPAHRFDWTRFAAATSPRLPDWSKGTQTRIRISWPMERRPRSPDRKLSVHRVCWF